MMAQRGMPSEETLALPREARQGGRTNVAHSPGEDPDPPRQARRPIEQLALGAVNGSNPGAPTTRPKRRPNVLPKGAVFASDAMREAARKEVLATRLIATLPQESIQEILGGERSMLQVPDPQDQADAVVRIILRLGGANGQGYDGAVRAIEVLRREASRTGQTNLCLPVSSLLAHKLIATEQARGVTAAKGALGGQSCGATLRSGFLWLRQHLGMDIAVEDRVCAAAAPKTKDIPGAGRRTAGTLPIRPVCQLELVAAATDPNLPPATCPLVGIARSLLAFGVGSGWRVQDCTRGDEFPVDSLDPQVMRATIRLSKNGNPMETFGWAQGLLGPYTWWPEHRAVCEERGTAFPACVHPWGSKGKLALSPAFAAGGQMSRDRIRAALVEILTLPPLSMSERQIQELRIGGHTLHGSLADWARAVGPFPVPPFPVGQEEMRNPGFGKEAVNTFGNWLRPAGLENDHAEDDSALVYREPPAPCHGAGGRSMGHRYSQGEFRIGSRAEQVRYRRRLAEYVARALANWLRVHKVPWWRLPQGRADLRILTEPAEDVLPLTATPLVVD